MVQILGKGEVCSSYETFRFQLHHPCSKTKLVESLSLFTWHLFPVPSYVYVIKARALLAEGAPGCQDLAELALSHGNSLLSRESTETSWADSTVTEGQKVKKMLSRSRLLKIPEPGEEPEALDAAVDSLDLAAVERLLSSTIEKTELERIETPVGKLSVGDWISVKRPDDLKTPMNEHTLFI